MEGTGQPESVCAQVKQWWLHALKTALVLKNEHFREECESRLVCADVSWRAGPETRVSPGRADPHQSCQFDELIIHNSTLHPDNCGIELVVLRQINSFSVRSTLFQKARGISRLQRRYWRRPIRPAMPTSSPGCAACAAACLTTRSG
ncbi:hypothetical protein [Bradyrhizobium sp. RDM12]